MYHPQKMRAYLKKMHNMAYTHQPPLSTLPIHSRRWILGGGMVASLPLNVFVWILPFAVPGVWTPTSTLSDMLASSARLNGLFALFSSILLNYTTAVFSIGLMEKYTRSISDHAIPDRKIADDYLDWKRYGVAYITALSALAISAFPISTAVWSNVIHFGSVGMVIVGATILASTSLQRPWNCCRVAGKILKGLMVGGTTCLACFVWLELSYVVYIMEAFLLTLASVVPVCVTVIGHI